MGRIIVSMALSVDGYSTGPRGDLSVMPLDERFNTHNAALIREATTLLYGGTTYRGMVAFWPTRGESPDASDAEREIAARIADGIPIVAISDSLTHDDTGAWRDQTTIVPRADAAEAIGRLRAADGDTVVFGSQTAWRELLAQGLVDELHLMIGPRLVAGDDPVFRGVPPTDLRLIDVSTFDDSPSVVLHYAVVPH